MSFRLGVIGVLALGIIATISTGHIWLKSYNDNRFDNSHWGYDLYQFWYAGHFFWQGQDPYTSCLTGEQPDYPAYLPLPRGSTRSAKLPRSGQVPILPGSAPLFLILAPLSLAPWVEATLCWGVINIFLGVIYVWLLLQLTKSKLFSNPGILLVFVLFSMQGTRQVIELGQNSLLISVSMFAAWYLQERQRPVLAGILLGIAISKYTLAFPILLYFLYRRWFKAAGAAFLTQFAGLVIIALVSRTDPRQIIRAYAAMSSLVMQQTQIDSIHLMRLSNGPAAYLVLGSISLAMVLGLFLWYNSRSANLRYDSAAGMALVGIVTLWSFISMYHSRHDMVAGLPLVVLASQCANTTRPKFSLGPWQLKLLYLLTAVILVIWVFPVYVLTGNIVYRYLVTISNGTASVLLFWLLFNIEVPKLVNSIELPLRSGNKIA